MTLRAAAGVGLSHGILSCLFVIGGATRPPLRATLPAVILFLVAFVAAIIPFVAAISVGATIIPVVPIVIPAVAPVPTAKVGLAWPWFTDKEGQQRREQ